MVEPGGGETHPGGTGAVVFPARTGQLIIALDPAGFGHGAFADRMGALAKAIESQHGARLSGMRRMALRDSAARDGIVLSGLLRQQIDAVGARTP
jgi:LDH2 family malate/lactate/ureidoglycolate dehydrogenase